MTDYLVFFQLTLELHADESPEAFELMSFLLGAHRHLHDGNFPNNDAELAETYELLWNSLEMNIAEPISMQLLGLVKAWFAVREANKAKNICP